MANNIPIRFSMPFSSGDSRSIRTGGPKKLTVDSKALKWLIFLKKKVLSGPWTSPPLISLSYKLVYFLLRAWKEEKEPILACK